MDRLEEIRKQLHSVTYGCRPDMHEPDEQSVKAYVIGDHLDNAMGAAIVPELLLCGHHEFVVIIEQQDGATLRRELFSLADLIALARRAE
jgi:hypothetical protein